MTDKSLFTVLSICCFMLAGLNANAQTIGGMVAGTNGRLSGAIVKNLRTNAEHISDERGIFSIAAKRGDTVLTSKLYYKTDTTVYNGQDYLIIQLRQATRLLRPVNITDTLVNPLNAYNQNKKDYKDIFWKGDDKHMVSIPFEIEFGLTMGINLNIDKLYSAVSMQGKDARRLQRTLAEQYRDDVVDQRFSRSFVGKITGYSGKKLDDFIMLYRPSYAFIVKASTYDIIQYIKKKERLVKG
jgi:hypothetical protein